MILRKGDSQIVEDLGTYEWDGKEHWVNVDDDKLSKYHKFLHREMCELLLSKGQEFELNKGSSNE